MIDTTENLRRKRVEEINSNPKYLFPRIRLEKEYGQVWDTAQLSKDFEPLGFMAPFIVVKRKSDGKKGSLMFQHDPRFYFRFQED